MRRGLPLLAWLALLGLLALVMLRRPGPEHSQAGLERLRAVDLAQGVDFPVDPGEERIKLVTWLVRPPTWARDVRSTLPVALELELLDPDGNILLQQEQWLRSRQSWRLGPGGSLLRPGWLPGSREELCDSRVVELDLAGLAPEGGRLRVRARPSAASSRVLAAAYRHALRTRTARLRFLGSGTPQANQRAAEQLGLSSWTDLPAGWKQRLALRVWERLGPLPTPGQGRLKSVELVHAPSEIPGESQPALGLAVPPGGAVSFNLLDGAVLEARWLDSAGRRASAAPTWLQTVQADGSTQVRFLGETEDIGPLTATGPLQSVQLALDPGTDGPRVLQAHVAAGPAQPDALVWGDPPRLPDPAQDDPAQDDPAQVDSWAIAPDLRIVEMVRLGAGLSPVRFRVEDSSLTLRLTLRPRLEPGPLQAFGLRWDPAVRDSAPVELATQPPREVLVVARDAEEHELARWLTSVEVRPSAFERYTQGDDPGTARAGEPEQRFLVPPPDTAWIEVSAASDVDTTLRIRRPTGLHGQVARGYSPPAELRPPEPADDSPLPRWHATGEHAPLDLPLARYEPYAQESWQVRAPEQLDALLSEGRVIRLDAQVRLEPAAQWAAEAWMARAAQDTEPSPPEAPLRGAVDLGGPFSLLAEPDRDGRSSAGGRVRLTPTTASLRVPDSGRLDIDYRVDPAQAGQQVVVQVDDQARPQTLWATAGRLRLLHLPPGERVQVQVDQPGLYLARAQGSPAWQIRKVIRLDPGQRRSIRIPGGPGSLALYAYGSGGWLDWSLQGGEPLEGPVMLDRITRPQGLHRLHTEGGVAWPLSQGGSPLPRLDPLVLLVGEDLGTGPLRLELELRGSETPIWLRATASWEACPGPGCESAIPSRSTLGTR